MLANQENIDTAKRVVRLATDACALIGLAVVLVDLGYTSGQADARNEGQEWKDSQCRPSSHSHYGDS
jgi:hypothetical protein